jgi:hypothetical protein
MIQWLEDSVLSAWLREQGFGAVVAARVTHVIGLALLVGSSAVWDARLIGFGKAISVRDLERIALPIARSGFALAALSGTLLFTANPVELSRNAVFHLKLGLIALALVNSLIYHRFTAAPRAHGLASLLLWVAVAILGRLIGYV